MRRPELAPILAEMPKLHYWPGAGGWNHGGFDDKHLCRLFDAVVDRRSAGAEPETLETGAGLSTLAFLAAGPRRHTSVAPDAELRDRILAQVERFGLDGTRLRFVTERSEEALPALTADVAPFVDVALIDGGHGFPTPFVDFCYIHRVLKRDGTLFVDDTQLHSAGQLAGLLQEQPGWETLRAVGKLAVFRKQNDARYLPDWFEQPFVVRQSAR